MQTKKIKRLSPKQRGDALLLSLFFSMLVIILGVSLSRFLVQDLFVLRDNIFSEKAYYVSESGVEKALLALKESPINDINVTEPFGSAVMNIVAQNNVVETVFDIHPNTTRRIKLVLDQDSSFVENKIAITDLELTAKNPGEISWRVICQKHLTNDVFGSVAVSDSFSSPHPSFSLGDQSGTLDDIELVAGRLKDLPSKTGKPNELFSLLTRDDDKKSCYLNLQNIGGSVVEATLKQPTGLSPETTKVISTGEIGGKKKVISFLFRQKNLGAFFDFGLLHTE